MICHGQPPFLECSSRGDKRFSAFFAVVNGLTIEQQYQAAKVLADGRTGLTIKEAKGKRAVNAAACAALYSRLWDAYIEEHYELWNILRDATGLSDVFGQAGHVCQATELWRIRARLISMFDQLKDQRFLASISD